MTSEENERETPPKEIVRDSDAVNHESKDLPQELPNEEGVIARRTEEVSMHFSGPIPHPELMAGYEQVLPDSANRILSMAESEQRERHKNMSAVVQAGIRREREGLFIGGFLALVFLVGSLILIGMGRTTEGLIAIGGETAILAIVYLRAQHVRNRSLKEGVSEEK